MVHALGFFIGLLPGLLLWYVYYDRSRWLRRHGLVATKLQSTMLFVYVSLVALYDRCHVTSKEILLLEKGRLYPLLQRPESIFIAALCVFAFILAWFTNLVLSMRSAITALRQNDVEDSNDYTGARQ